MTIQAQIQTWNQSDLIYSITKTYLAKKMQSLHRVLVEDVHMSNRILSSFSHIWIVDDNVKMPAASMKMFLSLVMRSNAYIAQPAVSQSHISLARPKLSCDIRFTDYVEIMAPLVNTCVLQHVLKYLYRKNVYSNWGIDMLWCKYTSHTFKLLSA